MKKVHALLILILLGCWLGSYAQETLVVEPGIGTLNAAINANHGSKIYVLKAGEWYQLDAVIENDGYHLQIIGQEPANGGKPATLQTNDDQGGAVFFSMFNAKGNLTLKNIYFVNCDLLGQIAQHFIEFNADNSALTMDHCVIHPPSTANPLEFYGMNDACYFTNNLALNMGQQLNPNDANFFAFNNPLDTLWVENNTFVAMGTGMFIGGWGNSINNVVCFNHNTFVLQKSQIDWSTRKMEQFWMNNLMFDMNTQPWSGAWMPMPGGDAVKPLPGLIYADTLVDEVLPSTRVAFVGYNLHYRAQGFYDNITKLNSIADTAKKPRVFLMQLVWPKDSLRSREAAMFNSEGFPLFKYTNTISDVDPEWIDQEIYNHQEALIGWTYPASFIHTLGYPADRMPDPTTWPKWHWYPSGDPSNNSVWPVFNGKYTNSQILTGSIESLPLGDLNWFPEQKAIWEAHKAEVMAHVKAGNTGKLSFTGIESVPMGLKVELYPNPASEVVNVAGDGLYDITITSIDGRSLMSVQKARSINVSHLSNGIYFISLKQGAQSYNQKIMIFR